MSIATESWEAEPSTLPRIPVRLDVGRKERPVTVFSCVWQRSHPKLKTWCAGIAQTLKVFSMSTARAASQSHTEHVHRKSTAILDACFHTDMHELIHAHPPGETEAEGVVVRLFSKAHYGTRKAAQVWQEFFRNEVFVSAGGNARAMEPNAYPKVEYWDDDDDSDSFVVEWRMDIKSATIIETTTQIVKQVSNWRSASITWVRLEPRTTRTTRNDWNEFSWERAKLRSLADGTETHLMLKRLVIADDSQL